jgi:hypothetical protein
LARDCPRLENGLGKEWDQSIRSSFGGALQFDNVRLATRIDDQVRSQTRNQWLDTDPPVNPAETGGEKPFKVIMGANVGRHKRFTSHMAMRVRTAMLPNMTMIGKKTIPVKRAEGRLTTWDGLFSSGQASARLQRP